MKNKLVLCSSLFMWALIFYTISVSQNVEFLRVVAIIGSFFIFIADIGLIAGKY